jgi:hypothetical protein
MSILYNTCIQRREKRQRQKEIQTNKENDDTEFIVIGFELFSVILTMFQPVFVLLDFTLTTFLQINFGFLLFIKYYA